MDVALISTPVDEAVRKLDEYLAAPGRQENEEYQRIAQAYEQLAKGTPLIVLSEVIANAPRDSRGRPMLAIARADQRQIRYQYSRSWDLERFETTMRNRVRTPEKQGLRISVRTGFVLPPQPGSSGWADGFSLVPIVPPSVRQRSRRRPRALNTHFVLWEVEAWADREINANPDRDPYLLERVGDDLFAVVGEWDLTDVERAIMRDRARAR